MAIIMENKQAVAVVKNKAHREFIMQQLVECVKTFNLAPDKRPTKPQELTSWESSHGRAAQAGGAAQQPPSTPGRAAQAGGAAPPPLGSTPRPAAEGTSGGVQVPPPLIPNGAPPQVPPLVLPPMVPAAATGPAAGASGLAAFGAEVLR